MNSSSQIVNGCRAQSFTVGPKFVPCQLGFNSEDFASWFLAILANFPAPPSRPPPVINSKVCLW